MDRQTAKEVLFNTSYAREVLLDLKEGIQISDERLNQAIDATYDTQGVCMFYVKNNKNRRQVSQWLEAMNNLDDNGKPKLKLVVNR